MAAYSSKRVQGILFDFDNTLVPTVEADLYAFHKAKEKLLEFFDAKDAENIALKFQTLVTKTNPWAPDSFKFDQHAWRVKLWENVLNSESGDSEKPSAVEMYEVWRSARLEKMVIENEFHRLSKNWQETTKLQLSPIVTQLSNKKRSKHLGLTDCSKLS